MWLQSLTHERVEDVSRSRLGDLIASVSNEGVHRRAKLTIVIVKAYYAYAMRIIVIFEQS